jgi:regulation of enolase protein 1 (concanavalin A-like superfamily)
VEPTVEVGGLPLALRWRPLPAPPSRSGHRRLEISAPGGTDLFADPMGTATARNAPRATGLPAGDFMLRALVTAELAATYDAGALLLYAGERAWAKLCLELSPQGVPTIVSVVTREVSDDCNSFTVDGQQVWLRVARLGPAFAFHASTEGRTWRLVRYFSLEAAAAVEVGFLAQSPTGAGCTAIFEQIAYLPERLADLRGGG